MTLQRVVRFSLLLCLCVFGQSEDIYQRVQKALGQSGTLALRAKNYADVERQLTELQVPDDRQRAEHLALRAAVEFLDGKMAEAAADFRQSEELGPVTETDRFTLAMALVRMEDEPGARAVLSALAKEQAGNALYWYWLGRLDYYQRRYGEAVANLEKAVELDPKAARGWDSLGLAWDMQGHLEQARQMFERAAQLNREQSNPSPWPPHNLGYLLLRLGELAKADELLRESLRYGGSLAQTHYYLARTLEKEDRTDEAIKEYEVAVAGDTTAADSCYSLAMLYRKMHREAEANAMFKEFRKRKSLAPQP